MEPCITQLERSLLARLSSAAEVEHGHAPGSTVHELELTCLEYEGLERLARGAGCTLDAFIRQAVAEAVSVRTN